MDRSRRHGPNRLQHYLQTHETVLGQFMYSGLVEEDGVAFEPGADGHFYFAGEILLRSGKLKLTVAKALEIVDAADPGDPLVQTTSYSYNVSIVGFGNIFRYCSPHDGEARTPLGGVGHDAIDRVSSVRQASRNWSWICATIGADSTTPRCYSEA